jgi:hypothetical protein
MTKFNRISLLLSEKDNNFSEVFRTDSMGWKELSGMRKWYRRKEKKIHKLQVITVKNKPIALVKHVKPVKKQSSNGFFQFNTVKWSDRERYIDRVIEWMYKYAHQWFHWKPCPEYIREMIRELLFGHRIVMLEPRYHGKSNTLLCLFAYWIIELRRTVMVIVQMDEMQRNFFEWLIAIFKSDEVIRDYGELLGRVSGKPAYSIKLVPSYQDGEPWAFFKAASIAGSYVGQHPAWTHLDDIIQKIVRNDQTFDYFMRDFDGNVLDLSPDKLTISGTRKDLDDFYIQMMKKGFSPLHNKAVEFIEGDFPDLKKDFIFKEHTYAGEIITEATGLTKEYLSRVKYKLLNRPGYTFEKLMLRYEYDPNSFFSQMQNEPIAPDGNRFKKDWWRSMSVEEVNAANTQGVLAHQLQLWVDPAFGKSHSSSDTAILVCAPFNGIFYVVEMIIGKYGSDILEGAIRAVANNFKIHVINIENDFYQITNRYGAGFLSEFRLELFYNKGEGEKMDRIDTLGTPWHKGEIMVYKTCTNYTEFHYQFLRFNPAHKRGKFDALDIVASAYRGNRKALGKLKGKTRIYSL